MKKIFPLKFFQLLLIIAISIGVGYVFGNYKINAEWKDYKPILSISNQSPPDSQNLDMRLFYEVVDKVNAEYYDKSKIDGKAMVNGAIAGMLESLGDPYTSFFPPKENEEFKTQLAGEFSGIGAELSLNEENQVSVVSPLDGSPAKAAGIKPGDLILKVDDKATYGWSIAQAVENIRGPKGTDVKLNILSENTREARDVVIKRDTIVIKSVTSWLKSFDCSGSECIERTCPTCSTIAYIRVSQFGDKTNQEWLETVNSLTPQIQRNNNFKGIVLDVRNNPGGYLHDAVYIASEFLKDGSTVVIQEDGQGNQQEMKVSRRGIMQDLPLVVLINKGSASASEILSGALRDFNRADLIGENSFGKGTIQQAVDIEGGGSVHLSIAKWLTPNETWVHEKGLSPDVLVEFDATKSAELNNEELDNQLIRAIKELAR